MADAANPHANPGLVDLGARLPGAIIEASYAGSDNFLGRPVDGYETPIALITAPAAEALARAQATLEAMHLTLRIFDAYRPQRAVADFKTWCAAPEDDPARKARYYPHLRRSEIIPAGYIVERSAHSRGSTVDLTIDGLDMGGIFDLFDPRSNTLHPDLTAQQRANRLLLKSVMSAAGFEYFPLEWWHFTLRDEPWPETYFDVPVSRTSVCPSTSVSQ